MCFFSGAAIIAFWQKITVSLHDVISIVKETEKA
jgi:hypothetical protein